MHVVPIVQARMGSRRLPGKVLKPLRGKAVLEHVIRRAGRAGLGQVVVATTELGEDEAVAGLAASCGALVVRGSVDDVLDRYLLAATEGRADHVVRITADCPCTDPLVIRRLVEAHLATGADYTANTHERSFPLGADVEVVTFQALEAAHREASRPFEREHVMPFVWMRPERFRLHNVAATPEEHAPELRVTLDTARDYLMLRALFDLLPEDFSIADVVRFAKQHPWLSEMNAGETQKNVYAHADPQDRARAEIIDAASWAGRQELFAAAAVLLESLESPTRLAAAATRDPTEIRRKVDHILLGRVNEAPGEGSAAAQGG